MNMATALASTALKMLSAQAIAESLCGTAHALTKLCERIQTHRLRTALKGNGFVCAEPLDGWSLPDAVWLSICRKQPGLNCYPLGEIAERAVKKTLIALLIQRAAPNAAVARLKLGEPEIQKNLRGSLAQLGEHGLLKLFLGHYFFETCIDYMRRPNDGAGPDWSYGYHFSKNRRMVSLKAERKLRKTLDKQCAELAARFFPSSKKRGDDAAHVEERIRTGFEKVFHLPLAQTNAAPRAAKPTVNAIVGTRSLAEIGKSFTVSRKKKRFLLDGDERNLSFSFDVLEEWLGRALHPLVKDLLEIGIAVHMSDLYTRRGRGLERSIGMIMPVRHPAVWSRACAEVEQAVASLGRDDFHIHFLKRKQPSDAGRKFSLKADGRCVCLFSGGIDSVAGAAWALENGLTPVFISHQAISQLAQIQKPLISQLERIYKRNLTSFRITEQALEEMASAGLADAVLEKLESLKGRAFLEAEEFSNAVKQRIGQRQFARYESSILKHARGLQHLSFFLGASRRRSGSYLLHSQPQTIMAQHLRSFLFLSVAAAVALETGISTVYVFENGPVALNPLFSEARVNTHTVHPHFLAHYRALIRAVFGVELRIENPFAYLTKGEVTSILAKTALRPLLSGTSSCWNWSRVLLRAYKLGIKGFKGRHDGDCFPCIHRRTSVHRANLWGVDDKYLVDIFNGSPLLSRETVVEVADYLRFCKNAASLSDSELLLSAPDFSVYEEAADTRDLIEMYREHAREVIHCFRARSDKEFRRAFASVLKI